ncbi:MAG: hypothetical protein ACYCPT_11620 [Acidimicrobiales bacterium]
MANENAATLWLQSDLNRQALNKALLAIEATGRALPCTVTAVNGSLVTVNFECTYPVVQNGSVVDATLPPLTLPKGESQWLRAPVQVGDVGMTIPADTFLGGISGYGSGVADLGKNYGNLTTLVWVPVAAVSFGAPPDPNKAWINGPAGAVVSDTPQTATMTASKNNVTHQAGSGGTQVTAIYDGQGNAISHVVSSGGLVGLGALATSLPTTSAAITNNDVSTFENSLHSQRLADLENLATAVSEGLAIASPPVALSASTIIGLIASLVHIPVPAGSSIVRVAGG